MVVDAMSTDDTAGIARGLGANVVLRPFTNYGDQKNAACQLATQPWILSIDADEVVTPQLAQEISSIVESNKTEFCGWRIPRRFHFLGKRFSFGSGSVDYPVRFFRKQFGTFSSNLVHEHVIIEGGIARCSAEMNHFSYGTLEQYFDKFNRYTSLAAQELVAKSRHRSVLFTATMVPVYFLRNYIFRGHLLNGVHGALWSIFSAVYPLVKVAKAWHLNSQKH